MSQDNPRNPEITQSFAAALEAAEERLLEAEEEEAYQTEWWNWIQDYRAQKFSRLAGLLVDPRTLELKPDSPEYWQAQSDWADHFFEVVQLDLAPDWPQEMLCPKAEIREVMHEFGKQLYANESWQVLFASKRGYQRLLEELRKKAQKTDPSRYGRYFYPDGWRYADDADDHSLAQAVFHLGEWWPLLKPCPEEKIIEVMLSYAEDYGGGEWHAFHGCTDCYPGLLRSLIRWAKEWKAS